MEISNSALEFIDPKLLILVPFLIYLGKILKDSVKIDNSRIPLLLGIIGIVMAAIWIIATRETEGFKDILLAAFTSIVQGIICTGVAVYGNQLFKQEKIWREKKDNE